MLIIVTRPQSPPLMESGARYTWVTKLPAPLRCSVYAWRLCILVGTWGWSHARFYTLPANWTWQQLIDSFPDMDDVFRDQYKTDYYLFADPEQVAASYYFHENRGV